MSWPRDPTVKFAKNPICSLFDWCYIFCSVTIWLGSVMFKCLCVRINEFSLTDNYALWLLMIAYIYVHVPQYIYYILTHTQLYLVCYLTAAPKSIRDHSAQHFTIASALYIASACCLHSLPSLFYSMSFYFSFFQFLFFSSCCCYCVLSVVLYIFSFLLFRILENVFLRCFFVLSLSRPPRDAYNFVGFGQPTQEKKLPKEHSYHC